ncbi:hypothetical protein [Plesiomonas sp.]|uniref:hypothetical protein n=1 Tax=Plesiomonas sp. TaxID=2486279 RepID=UPI003F3E1505
MYYAGDQIAYSNFYNNASSFSFSDAVVFYKNSLDSQEPLYFLLVYTLSDFFSKNILFSIINAVFVSSVYFLLRRMEVSKLIVGLFGFNFYLYVLMFSAERLKLSFLFLVVALIVRNKSFSKLLIFLSVFTHVQTLILVTITQYKRFDNFLFKMRRLFRGYWSNSFTVLILFFISMCLFVLLMWGHLSHKVVYYYNNMSGLSEIVKPLVFTLISLPYAKNRYQALFAGGTIMLLSVFLGGERLVIFSYFVFLYYGLNYKRGLNFWVVLTSTYFSVKGFIFLMSIYHFGDGFIG